MAKEVFETTDINEVAYAMTQGLAFDHESRGGKVYFCFADKRKAMPVIAEYHMKSKMCYPKEFMDYLNELRDIIHA